MNINKLWVLFLILAGGLNISGQQRREITSEEFGQAKINSRKKMIEANRRMSTKFETFSTVTGELQQSGTLLFEVLEPGTTRYVSTDTSGGLTRKKEVIQINDVEYRRVDDGEWTKNEVGGIGSVSGEKSGSGGLNFKIADKKYTVSETMLGDESAQVFESYVSIDEATDNRYSHEKFWIDKNGRLRKAEYQSGFEKSGRVLIRIGGDYEYDLKHLKIEAPIK